MPKPVDHKASKAGKGVKERTSSVLPRDQFALSRGKLHSPESLMGSTSLVSNHDIGEKNIVVTIETLRNIATKSPSRDITIHVDNGEGFSYESSIIGLQESETTLDWEFLFPCFPSKTRWLDELAAHPLLFTLVEVEAVAEKESRETKKKDSKLMEVPAQSSKVERVLGNCTLDLLPFLLGETRVRQVLLVEQDLEAYGHEVKTWPNLPQLTVRAAIDEPLLTAGEVDQFNLLFVTLESLYNTTTEMTEELEYKAATCLPQHSARPREVVFDQGVWTDERDTDRMKRWIGYADVAGRGAHSNYRLDHPQTVQNKLKVDVVRKMEEEAPRVEWNALRRCWLSGDDAQAIQNHLAQYRWWPLEILAVERVEEEPDAKSEPVESVLHLAAYFDMSALLYPGVTRARVVSQVFTFCQEDMMARCAVGRSLFFQPSEPGTPEPTDSVNDSRKGNSGRSSSKEGDSKTSSKGGKPDKKGLKLMPDKKSSKSLSEQPSKVMDKKPAKDATPKKKPVKPVVDKESKFSKKSGAKGEEEDGDLSDSDEDPSVNEDFSAPVFTEDGEPVFVILELQLLKPFQPKKELEHVVKGVDEVIPESKVKFPPHCMTHTLAEQHFQDCVRAISGKVIAEYQRFVQDTSPGPGQDEDDDENRVHEEFYRHLQDKGFYQTIKDTLLHKITLLVREKMGYGFSLVERAERHGFMADVFVFLMERVHAILNTQMAVGVCPKVSSGTAPDELYLFARVEGEEGRAATAERLLESVVNENKGSPEWWVAYAVFAMGARRWEKAGQLALEALSLDRRHKLALLVFALVMSEQGEENSAFLFLDALTSLYPRFTEGWVVFHLFHLKTKTHVAAAATLQQAQMCTSSHTRDAVTGPVVDADPVAWDPRALPLGDSIFLHTAALLMRLNALYYAEMALALESQYHHASLSFTYYLSVNHYLEGRFADALSHLEAGLTEYCEDAALWALAGHCHFKLGHVAEALDHYRFVVECGAGVPDLYLIYLRLSEHELRRQGLKAAKLYSLLSCQQRATPRAWLNTGVSCYLWNEFADAEKALMEANLLDNLCPVTWAYLALVNLQFHRQTEFELCYRQAVQNGLLDEELIKYVASLRMSLNYPDPCPLHPGP